MKKIVSVFLSVLLIMGMVMTMPFAVSAITIEEVQSEALLNEEVTSFDFETDGVIKVGSQSLSDDKVSWKVDTTNTLEYYYSGWGFSCIADNPVKTSTDGEGSIVNSSNKVLGAVKTTYNTWSTGGGFVINNETALGTKPYILESNTTYTVEFDYLIESTHLYGDVTKPDGTSMTISSDAVDTLSIGYGYKENTDTQLAAVSGHRVLIETVATYKPSRDLDGTFTAYDGVKEVGNWYHFSATFKTGAFESIYSTNNAPFLILYANMYIGAAMYVDNFSVGKTDTNSAFFDYEDKEYMYVTSQGQTAEKCVWNVDPLNIIEYHIAGWGFSTIADNPVTEPTGVTGSTVNTSNKVMQARKTTYNTWSTSGGIVMNRKTEKGIEAIVLEDNTTYTVEFDYLVNGTHIYGNYIDPNDATNAGTISENTESYISFGYGYKTTTSTGLAPVNRPNTTVAKIASYKPSANEDGTYTDYSSTTRQVGSWYHQSHTFTTGTFDSIYSVNTNPTTANAPFLVFYATMSTGDWFMVDNIRITKHVNINLNANGGTASVSSMSGEIGKALTLPTATRFGYEFTGWYKDSACTVPFTDAIFTKENAGTTIFAGWKMGIEGFENYIFIGNGPNMSVSTEQAYIGTNSIKYSWTKANVDLFSGRTSEKHYFGVQTLSDAGTYKMTFKYYISGSANITAYPVLVGASNSNTVTKPTLNGVTSVTLSTSAAGRWQTMSIVFTTASSISSSANILALHMHAESNADVTIYVDDVQVSPVESDTGTGSLTVYGGAGTTAGVSSRSVALVNGDVIDNGFVYKEGYAVEGWYTDSALTKKIPADVYRTSIPAAYPKFSDRVDLTADGTRTRTGGFKAANYEDVLYYSGSFGTASLAQVTSGNTYMVEFLYKNKGGTDVTLTAESGSFVAKRNTPDTWRKGYIPVTATSTGALTLSASGSSTLEIKDVYIKDLSGLVYILFDSTEYGGGVTAVYGEAGSAISFPANPIVSGKQFGGWYNGSTKFTATVFPSDSVSLTATMVLAGTNVAGDCDGDGKCNTTDLAKMKLYLAKVDSEIAAGADMNGDGKVNAIDLVLLYKELLNAN